MRVAYIADGRSPTTAGWIRTARIGGVEPVLISTYPVDDARWDGTELHVLPVAFASASAAGAEAASGASSSLPRRALTVAKRSNRTLDAAAYVRNVAGPIEVRRHKRALETILDAIRPDVVHALRIPFEGLALGTTSKGHAPWMASIWGNDLTLHARMNPLIARATRSLLHRLDALGADTQRDIALGQAFGLPPGRPTIVAPGGGGIDSEAFLPGAADNAALADLGVSLDRPILLNPRGFRPKSLRQDRFFEALPAVRSAHPGIQVVCVAMAGSPVAEHAVDSLDLRDFVTLLPPIPHAAMAELFRAASVTISPSIHDGTPNSLLEAMACGVFPIAGNIDSAREWIRDGENGLLCDANSAGAIAAAINLAFASPELRDAAAAINARIISQRASRTAIAGEIGAFYARLARLS